MRKGEGGGRFIRGKWTEERRDMLANRVREGYRWMISKISNLGGIVKTKAMDTADPRDRQTGGGLSTEKQNITSTALVCVCVYVCVGMCVWKIKLQTWLILVLQRERSGLLQKWESPPKILLLVKPPYYIFCFTMYVVSTGGHMWEILHYTSAKWSLNNWTDEGRDALFARLRKCQCERLNIYPE